MFTTPTARAALRSLTNLLKIHVPPSPASCKELNGTNRDGVCLHSTPVCAAVCLVLTAFSPSQDVQTVGANNLLRNLISHTNLISCTLFKCVLFKEDSAPSVAQPKHRPIPFQPRGSRGADAAV